MKEVLVVYGARSFEQVNSVFLNGAVKIPTIIHGWSEKKKINYRPVKKMGVILESTACGFLPELPQDTYLKQLSIGRGLQESFKKNIYSSEEVVTYLVDISKIHLFSKLQCTFREKYLKEDNIFNYTENFMVGYWTESGSFEDGAVVLSKTASQILTAYPGLKERSLKKFCTLRGIRMITL